LFLENTKIVFVFGRSSDPDPAEELVTLPLTPSWQGMGYPLSIFT